MHLGVDCVYLDKLNSKQYCFMLPSNMFKMWSKEKRKKGSCIVTGKSVIENLKMPFWCLLSINH